MILFIQTYGMAQVYIFDGDPDLILEQGTYKQNYNTGMYFIICEIGKMRLLC